MEKQHTLAKEVTIEGIGLHTGNISKLTFKPAPENNGIKFIREDLPGMPKIDASYKHVAGTVRGTTIGTDPAKVHTIEHILAVFSSLGIDNADVYLTNNEPPITDGSAKHFVDMVLSAGTKEQNAQREYLTLTKPVMFENENVKYEAYPSDEFKIDCKVSYNHPYLNEQSASITVTKDTFINDISKARTFCFDYEIEALKLKGLAKGGNLSNAIVIGLNDIHNPDKKLRYKEEFVRHKILDLIGDLYLLGKPLKAHIIASRPGHANNITFAKKIAESIAENKKVKQEEVKMQETNNQGQGQEIHLDINAIKKIIPHRYPFLLIDKAIVNKDGKTAKGIKCVSGNEEFFQGHFPGQPIMPGVLIVEAMAQTSCVLFLAKPEFKEKIAMFMSIDNVKFRKTVVPGDVLDMRIEVLKAGGRGGKIRGETYVNNVLTTEAEFMFILADKANNPE